MIDILPANYFICTGYCIQSRYLSILTILHTYICMYTMTMKKVHLINLINVSLVFVVTGINIHIVSIVICVVCVFYTLIVSISYVLCYNFITTLIIIIRNYRVV